MNKSLYRIIFNARRHQLMVVALSLAGHTTSAFAQVSAPVVAEPSQMQTPTSVPVTPPESTSTEPIATTSSPSTTAASVVAPPPPVQRMLPVVYSYTGADQSKTKPIMDDLRVVHLSALQKNVGAQVALNVAMLMLGGGMGFSGVSKNDFAGALPEDVKDKSRLKNPALTQLVQEVERQSADWLASNPKTSELKFTKPLVISSAAWRLIYNSQSADDKTYQLRFDADIYKIRDKKSFFSNPASTGKACSYASQARPLDEWKANDYQAVVDLTPIVVAQCAKEFTAQLPDLLDLK